MRAPAPPAPPAASRPSFWIYHLPAALSTWHLSLAGYNSDYGRNDGVAWLEMMLRSAHRAASPEDADFFVVPVVGPASLAVSRPLRHAATRWAIFNESVRRDVADHILPPR